MSRLTWEDLLIENLNAEECRDWLAPWSRVVNGTIAPAFLNKFGSWFLHRPEGHIEMLDVFTGRLHQIADSYDELRNAVNEPWWQEVYLLSDLVFQLHAAGKAPGPGQCYVLAPHPALGGPNPANGEEIDPRFVMIAEVGLWQFICAQSLGLVTDGDSGDGLGKF